MGMTAADAENLADMVDERDASIAELEARCAEIAHAYDVTFKRRTELELAILPFVEFAAHAVDVEQGVWATGVHREPISTWLGPSDFAAVAKLKA